jgi:hypothetical protein
LELWAGQEELALAASSALFLPLEEGAVVFMFSYANREELPGIYKFPPSPFPFTKWKER